MFALLLDMHLPLASAEKDRLSKWTVLGLRVELVERLRERDFGSTMRAAAA